MNVGGFFDVFGTVFAIAAFVTLLLSFVAAAYGAREGATRFLRLFAMPCGCLSGVVVAAIVGIGVASGSDSPVAFVLGLVLGPLFGGAASYVIARLVAWPNR